MLQPIRRPLGRLACFSPAIMLGTFLIEYLLAGAVLLRYRHHPLGQLAGLTLFMLGTFQLAEYAICTADAQAWVLPGVIAITLLPPLGLHMIGLYSRPSALVTGAYLVAGLFVAIFGFLPGALTGGTCGGNYVILHIANGLGLAYGIYYFGYLFAGLWQARRILQADQLTPHRRASLVWLIVGYLSFLLPMAIVYLAAPPSRSAIPSIMCGFALIFAIILAVKVVPEGTHD